MKKLNETFFPHAGMKNLRFKTVDGCIHSGKYDFNETGARRWFDEYDNQYTSDLVNEWEVVR